MPTQSATSRLNWGKPYDRGTGPVKRGLGVALQTWGGGGHASQCRTVINPDGSVQVELGSQDLGTGTKTIIVQVAAETLDVVPHNGKLKIASTLEPRKRRLSYPELAGRALDEQR